MNPAIELTLNQAFDFLLHVAVVRPVFLWGAPDIGKTALVNRLLSLAERRRGGPRSDARRRKPRRGADSWKDGPWPGNRRWTRSRRPSTSPSTTRPLGRSPGLAGVNGGWHDLGSSQAPGATARMGVERLVWRAVQ